MLNVPWKWLIFVTECWNFLTAQLFIMKSAIEILKKGLAKLQQQVQGSTRDLTVTMLTFLNQFQCVMRHSRLPLHSRDIFAPLVMICYSPTSWRGCWTHLDSRPGQLKCEAWQKPSRQTFLLVNSFILIWDGWYGLLHKYLALMNPWIPLPHRTHTPS